MKKRLSSPVALAKALSQNGVDAKKIASKNFRPFWVTEWFTPHSVHRHHMKRFLVHTKTRFQRAQVAETFSFGRCLILDGEMQSAEMDEFIYHESLVHPALLLHPNPKDVLIMGGGEGATSREILKHRSIRRCVMVDIDGEVIRFCKKYLQAWHQGCFADPRSQVIIGDAKKFIEDTQEKFDIIISDLPTPIEAGPATLLYTVEFYKTLLQRLRPGGLFALQAGSGNLLQIEMHKVLCSTLRSVFKRVWPYYAHVPSFDVPWAFLVCGGADCNPLRQNEAALDRMIRKRVRGPLRFYDGTTHAGLFRIPKHLRTDLRAEKRLITRKHPIYFYK